VPFASEGSAFLRRAMRETIYLVIPNSWMRDLLFFNATE
jgi:hypothetical protein